MRELQEAVHAYYEETPRDFPWRRTRDPWSILVSEVMLQQTQVSRVIPKYLSWMERFPDPGVLAAAGLAEVLALWSGLGYNRRAVALRDAARAIVGEFGGRVPRGEAGLRKLPGVGPYTARAIMAFAFGTRVAFIETNIRAVFIHFCFAGLRNIHDRDILPLAEAALAGEDPREWQYALMDYGAALKKIAPNPNTRSAGYVRQARFTGSLRQARGAIVAGLAKGRLGRDVLYESVGMERERFEKALEALVSERIVACEGGIVRIRD
ncbi:MAG: A/G-specific adenine glycosylase [Spirochaetes bacterium]|nr:A/G-specific adenine glycosylase [Spirochaetota bacterium]